MNIHRTSLVAAVVSLAALAGPVLAQSGGGSGGAGSGGVGAGGTTGPLGSGAPNPGLNANTTPGNRIGPGGAPLATGSSGAGVPTYGTGPGGVPQAIGPSRDTTGSSVGSGSPSTTSGRAGCATESQTATSAGTIYQRDATGLGPAPRIMNEEPGRPASAATGRSDAGC